MLDTSSAVSALKSVKVEKRSSEKSPAVQEVPAWCRSYQLRLDAAKEQLKLIMEAGEP